MHGLHGTCKEFPVEIGLDPHKASVRTGKAICYIVTLPLQAGVRVHAACRTERELHKLSNYSRIRCGPLKRPDIQRPKTKAGRMPTASLVWGDIYALPPMAKGLHGSDCTTGRD